MIHYRLVYMKKKDVPMRNTLARYHLVCGEFPNTEIEIGLLSEFEPNVEVKERLVLAVHALRRDVTDYVIVSGGMTRPGSPSEAKLYGDWIFRTYPEIDHNRILLEDAALSTGAHIANLLPFLRDMGLPEPRKVVVLGRRSQIWKLRAYAWNIWSEETFLEEFVGCSDTKPWWWRLLDRTVFTLFAFADPHERVLGLAISVRLWGYKATLGKK